MKITCVGGGPGGLYFAVLMKKADPRHEIRVIERNRAEDTFGFGVVFSDATMAGIAGADSDAYSGIARHLVHWDDIEVHYRGERITSTGHGFSGMSRHTLLRVLQEQACAAGVELLFEREVSSLDALRDVDLVVAADGSNSTVRQLLQTRISTTIDLRPNRFVWLGTTKPFPAFTFYFKHHDHGLWRVHAYQYGPDRSTFIVECGERTWKAAGMDRATEAETAAFLERLFAEKLDGHRLITNRSIWRQFPTVRTEPWYGATERGNVVLLGDAAHTAHFSVGSGTRMAMEDAVALRDSLVSVTDIPSALRAYEARRRPLVESLQRAAQASLQWFEDTERYLSLDAVQFVFSLLTRSLRITHEDLRARDPQFLARVDEHVARQAELQTGRPAISIPPPMFTPFRLRDLVLPNRVVVSPMCQYVADDGTIGDWHLVHLGSRAMGGAGLVMAEMTDVSRDARISPWCAGLYRPEHAAAWKRIVDFVHRETPAAIGIQLGHAGRKGATQQLWVADNEPLPDPDDRWPLVSASPIPFFPDRSPVPRAMTRADMDCAVADYARAAELAHEAGFDLLEIHMAHGYLLASFISPLTNTRADEYGGRIGKPDAIPARSVRRLPRRVARREADERAHQRRGLGARRYGARGCRGGCAPVEGARLRRRRCLGGTDGGGPTPRLRPAVSNAVRRSDPPSSGDGDNGGGEHFVVHGCEHHHRRRARRLVPARAGAHLRPVLDATRRVDARLPAPVARAVQVGGALHAAIRIPVHRRKVIEQCLRRTHRRPSPTAAI